MIKSVNFILICIFLGTFLSSCSQVLQTIDLTVNNEDNSKQEDFNVIERTLTLKEAKTQSQAKYIRSVLQPGRGAKARTISENLALKSTFPKDQKEIDYKIGIGDTLSFTKLIDNKHKQSLGQTNWPKKIDGLNYILGIGDNLTLTLLKDPVYSNLNRSQSGGSDSDQTFSLPQNQNQITIVSTGRIGSDGSVLLLEVGRLEASGKTLNELRSEVRNILIRNGISPRFQLEIDQFTSQKAYLTVNGVSEVITLEDQKTSLTNLLAAAGIGFKTGVKTLVTLQRNKKDYLMYLRDIFNDKAPQVFIADNDHIFVEDIASSLQSSTSTVGYDGFVVFAGVGKLKADGLTLKELETEISSRMEQIPDSENAFQIKLENPLSQTAIVSIPGKMGGVIHLGDTPIPLDQILTENGLSVDRKHITQINLQRTGKSYNFTIEDLLKLPADERLYLRPNDKISTEILIYKENKVFLLGAVNPQIFKIDPVNRETLADVLFTSGGPLSSSSAKRSEVYLLRGGNPVVAYHLDAQSPTRLIVADAMELRPNDIIFVAEQPIISFNRTLATIVPLRILLRDIQDENIP